MAAILALIPSLVLTGLFLWFTLRVMQKAGYSGWWALIGFVPVVNIVMLWVFAFADWPALAAIRGGGSSGRVTGDSPIAGGTILDRAYRDETRDDRAPDFAPVGDRWMLSGFDGEGHAVRLDFAAADAETGDGLIIGRSPAESDLILADTSVSRRHARLFGRGGRLFVEDAGSANGTRVDGRRLAEDEPAEITEGTDIELGETRLRLSQA